MNKKGFTLIELLVVVLIIGILSSVALPQYTAAVEKSRATEGWTMVKAINDALAIKNMEMGTTGQSYPFDELSISFTDKNGATASSYKFQTKNFTHHIASGQAVAERNVPGGGYYWLSVYNGKRRCFDGSSSNPWCKKLGFSTAGTSCISQASNGTVGAWNSASCFTE